MEDYLLGRTLNLSSGLGWRKRLRQESVSALSSSPGNRADDSCTRVHALKCKNKRRASKECLHCLPWRDKEGCCRFSIPSLDGVSISLNDVLPDSCVGLTNGCLNTELLKSSVHLWLTFAHNNRLLFSAPHTPAHADLCASRHLFMGPPADAARLA
eukprot:1158815-Pelagomonas_calceolata.AAC.8